MEIDAKVVDISFMNRIFLALPVIRVSRERLRNVDFGDFMSLGAWNYDL